jgi:beta-lactam-binding protein with PASTA domain
MTYEKAVKALIDAGLMVDDKREAAIQVLAAPSIEFTYPDWAQALQEAGVIAGMDVDKAAEVMQEAGLKEAEEGGEDFDEALGNAGIL